MQLVYTNVGRNGPVKVRLLGTRVLGCGEHNLQVTENKGVTGKGADKHKIRLRLRTMQKREPMAYSLRGENPRYPFSHSRAPRTTRALRPLLAMISRRATRYDASRSTSVSGGSFM